jgi:hypothetical protein
MAPRRFLEQQMTQSVSWAAAAAAVAETKRNPQERHDR